MVKLSIQLAWLGIFIHGIVMAGDDPNSTFTFKNQELICITLGDSKIVDRDKLAKQMLAQNPINIANIAPPSDNLDYKGLIRYIIGHNICDGEGAKCDETDKINWSIIESELSNVWLGNNKYYTVLIPPTDKTEYKDNKLHYISKRRAEFFENPNDNNYTHIECLSEAESKKMEAMNDKKDMEDIKRVSIPPKVFTSPEKPGSQIGLVPSWGDFRLRGKIDDIFIDRSQVVNFNVATPAVLSFSTDNVTQTTTETFQAVVGYPLLNLSHYINGSSLGIDIRRFDLIPYVGVNRLIVSTPKGSSTKPSANETVDFGFSANSLILSNNNGGYSGEVISLRPHYLMDLQSGSRILSTNGRWIPYPTSVRFNDFRGLGPYMSFKPILDFRLDGGTYLNRGSPSVASSNKDYLRIGGQAGFSLVSDAVKFPLSFLATYTGLYGAVGNVNVGYFSNMLTYSFDQKKYFGVTVSYSNGNLEDNAAKRVNMWTIGLSGRY
jgi:hypothetical protein